MIDKLGIQANNGAMENSEYLRFVDGLPRMKLHVK